MAKGPARTPVATECKSERACASRIKKGYTGQTSEAMTKPGEGPSGSLREAGYIEKGPLGPDKAGRVC